MICFSQFYLTLKNPAINTIHKLNHQYLRFTVDILWFLLKAYPKSSIVSHVLKCLITNANCILSIDTDSGCDDFLTGLAIKVNILKIRLPLSSRFIPLYGDYCCRCFSMTYINANYILMSCFVWND